MVQLGRRGKEGEGGERREEGGRRVMEGSGGAFYQISLAYGNEEEL